MSRLLVALTIAWVLAAVPAGAQFGTFLDVQLERSDLDLMGAAAREGLDGKAVGDVVSWDNDETEAFGSVKLLERFDRDGNECRKVHHLFSTNREPHGSVVSTICKIDGRWLVLE